VEFSMVAKWMATLPSSIIFKCSESIAELLKRFIVSIFLYSYIPTWEISRFLKYFIKP